MLLLLIRFLLRIPLLQRNLPLLFLLYQLVPVALGLSGATFLVD